MLVARWRSGRRRTRPPARSPHASLRLGWLWRRWCSGRRRARPPARSPHASLRLGVVDLEARPCPPVPPAPSTPAAPGRWGVAWRVVSKPGQALPPPTGTAARPRRLRDGLQSGVRVCLFWPCRCIPCGDIRRVWAHPDRLPLSGSSLPIRIFVTYPDVCYLSGCVAAWARWPPCGVATGPASGLRGCSFACNSL